MIIHCPKCGTDFDLPKKLINKDEKSTTLSCSICNHEWEEETSVLLSKDEEPVKDIVEEKAEIKNSSEEKIIIEDDEVEVEMDSAPLHKEVVSEKDIHKDKKTIFGMLLLLLTAFQEFLSNIFKALLKPRSLLFIILISASLVLLISIGEKAPTFDNSNNEIVETDTTKDVSMAKKHLNIKLIPPINLVTKGNRKFLLIKGSVENTSDFRIKFPPIKLETFDDNNQVVDFISKNMGDKIIQPKENKRFSIMLELSGKDYSYVEVNFVR
jgi:transcription elongation factor Elf1